MNDTTRQQLIQKLGTLMFANAELAAQSEILFAELSKAQARIKQLEEVQEAAAKEAVKAANGHAANQREGDVKH